MSKRLFKLEYMETKKIMYIITAFIAGYMILSAVCSAFSYSATDKAFALKTIFVFISALLIICSALIMVKRYYNILFSNEGYVRLSFPVKNRGHLHANLKYAFIWLGLQILVFFAGLSLSDLLSKTRFEQWGITNLYPDILESYSFNFRGEYLLSPKLKAMIAVLFIIISTAIIAINIYLSFIFTLTVSNYICSKYNIVQKPGVIFLTGVFMYCIHLLAVQLFNVFTIWFNNDFLDNTGYKIFGVNTIFIYDIYKPIIFILFYGITAIVMYRICRSILDKKLDI